MFSSKFCRKIVGVNFKSLLDGKSLKWSCDPSLKAVLHFPGVNVLRISITVEKQLVLRGRVGLKQIGTAVNHHRGWRSGTLWLLLTKHASIGANDLLKGT